MKNSGLAVLLSALIYSQVPVAASEVLDNNSTHNPGCTQTIKAIFVEGQDTAMSHKLILPINPHITLAHLHQLVEDRFSYRPGHYCIKHCQRILERDSQKLSAILTTPTVCFVIEPIRNPQNVKEKQQDIIEPVNLSVASDNIFPDPEFEQ